MTIESAIEYLSDLANTYLTWIPVTKRTANELKKAIFLAISALKTIEDMNTKGE